MREAGRLGVADRHDDRVHAALLAAPSVEALYSLLNNVIDRDAA